MTARPSYEKNLCSINKNILKKKNNCISEMMCGAAVSAPNVLT